MKNHIQQNSHGKPFAMRTALSIILVIVLMCSMSVTAFAYFSDVVNVSVSETSSATYALSICDKASNAVESVYVCPNTSDGVHSFTLTAEGSASTGYCVIEIGEDKYFTTQINHSDSIKLSIIAEENTEIVFTPSWGKPAVSDTLYGDGDTIVYSEIVAPNPFAGKTISTLGDSISTYTGWSDVNPITSEDCKYRYGEAYYGPVGGDFHNTDLLVEDTWWHQAAQELGAEILISNAGNSTGLLIASYPQSLEWQQYLQEMLAYKSRPYYLGTADRDPDIIALYIGSSDVARATLEQFGSIDAVDFDTLIVKNDDGSYTYAEPQTVAEAYSILIHKINVTYPNAEVYCFTVVPNSGGYLSTCNKRLVSVVPFNEMIKGVAEHFDAIVVDIYDEFNLDPDGDGVAVQEDLDIFKSYFNGDPHPNAAGFDVITKRFVETVRANSKYNH